MKTIENKVLFSISELIQLGAKESALNFIKNKTVIETEAYFYYDSLPHPIQNLIIIDLNKDISIIGNKAIKNYNYLPIELQGIIYNAIKKSERKALKGKLDHGDISKIVSRSKISRKRICSFLDGMSENTEAGKAIVNFIKEKMNQKAYLNQQAALLTKELQEQGFNIVE